MSGKRSRPISLVVNNADFGSPEAIRQAHHAELEQADPNDITTRRIRVETDMITWYERRRLFLSPSERQDDRLNQIRADACRMLAAITYKAGQMPSCTGSYQPAITGRLSELSDSRIAAQTKLNHAIEFLNGVGRDAFDLIEAVAVRGQSAGRYMLVKYGMSPHEALEALVKFSDRLAVHFGLKR